MSDTAPERRARRQLAKAGDRLIRYRINSPHYNQYGPYAIADEFNNLVVYGIRDLAEFGALGQVSN